MSKDNMVSKQSGASKLELLRQKRGIKAQAVDVEKAIDGLASSIDSQAMMAEIERNSAVVNLIVDRSGSTDGTSEIISEEINGFAARQARKIYKTKLSLTVFNEKAYSKLDKVDTRQFAPISPWDCCGGTNIYDALFSAITSVLRTDASHILHLLITDGENGRSNHTQEQVRKLLEDRKMRGEHVFLLYNDLVDARTHESSKAYARELGIDPANSANFNRRGDGIRIIFQAIEGLLDGLRTSGEISKDWAKAIEAHTSNPLGIKARETKYLK